MTMYGAQSDGTRIGRDGQPVRDRPPYLSGGRLGHFGAPTAWRTYSASPAAPLARREAVTRASAMGSRMLGLTIEDRRSQLLGFGMARRRGVSLELLG